MFSPLTRRSLAAAAIATSLFLAGCGSSEPDDTTTPSPSAVMTSEAADPVETSSPEETMESTPAPEETTPSAAAAVETGPLEGDALNENGVAWFGTFCSGLTAVLEDAQPDTEGMDKDAVIDAIATAYQSLGDSFVSFADDLTASDSDMNFENSEAFASDVVDRMNKAGARYLEGSQEVRDGVFEEPDELTAVINGVEGDVLALSGDGFGIVELDESVQGEVGQIPECQQLST